MVKEDCCFCRGILRGILILGVAGVFAIILIPIYADYGPRAALDESYHRLAPYRDNIARIVVEHGSVESAGINITIPEEDYKRLNVDYARIFPDGTILIHHAEHGQVVIWEPSITAKKVSWKCKGWPKRDVFPDCR